MALQGKYKNIVTEEIFENAYWIIDSIHTEVVFNVDGIEENFIFVSMSVYENIELPLILNKVDKLLPLTSHAVEHGRVAGSYLSSLDGQT